MVNPDSGPLKGIRPRTKRKRRKRIARDIRGQGKAASYARYSSEIQNETSNADQHRKNGEGADTNRETIAPKNLYSDSAVSGTKLQREGLDQLLADAEAGEFSTIYFFSLSRLARECLIGLSIIKRLVHKLGIRVISTSEGLDTDQEGWEMHAHLLLMFHQKFIEQLAADVFRAQEGVVLGSNSVGDHRFGYTSTPIPGAHPQGRGKKTPKQYGIHEVEASWVVAIFRWYAEKKLSLTRIVRLLNNRKVHKGHRAKKKHKWSHSNVVSILESTKYVGLWPWGLLENHRDPATGRTWQEPRDESDLSDKWMRYRPDLQIVDVELFKAAQARLDASREENAKYRRESGKFKSNRGSQGNPPRHLLSNLLYCQCGHKLYIGGANGKYLFCPDYKKGLCKCKTNVRKDLATRLIMELITKAISDDDAWLEETFRATKSRWELVSQQVHHEIASLNKSLGEVESKIGKLLDRIENGNDEISVDNRLRERQRERQDILSKLADVERRQIQKSEPPTKDWTQTKLSEMAISQSESDPALINAVHRLLGNKITLQEIKPEQGRPYLRGKVVLKISNATALLLGSESPENERQEKDCVVFIDFKDPDRMQKITEQSEKAKALYDQELMNAQIAKILGVSKSMVTKLLRHWFNSRGLTMPDGRTRRSNLPKKHLEEPYYQRVADQVKELIDKGLLLDEIADVISCDRNTITAAARHWHESRGLEYVDGRTRRKTLERKSRT